MGKHCKIYITYFIKLKWIIALNITVIILKTTISNWMMLFWTQLMTDVIRFSYKDNSKNLQKFVTCLDTINKEKQNDGMFHVCSYFQFPIISE